MANPTPVHGPRPGLPLPDPVLAPPDNTSLALWIWLSSDGVLFAALFATFFLLRGQTNGGLTIHQIVDIPGATLGTLVALGSSVTMAAAAGQRGADRLPSLRRWLVVTGILGAIYVGLQWHEFAGLLHRGFTLKTSPLASSFYTIDGLDDAHWLFGVLWVMGLLVNTYRPEFMHESAVKMRALSLYWHFITVVWVTIFTLVYLLGKV